MNLRVFFLLALLGLTQCRAADAPQDSAPLPIAPPPVWEKNWNAEASPLLLKELKDKVAHSRVGGRVALAVYSLRHQRFEAEWNDTEWFTPASCLKLVVTAAVMDTFPVNFYPTTTLEVTGKLESKTLRGALRVIGGGDPNVSDRFFSDALFPLLQWADSLKGLGVDTLRGNVEVSDTFFTGPRRPAAWMQHHFDTWYGAEISALSFNDNTFTLTVSPSEKAGQPPQVTIVPEVGYVRVINKARTVPGRKSRIGIFQRQDSTVITITGRMGNRATPHVSILPVRNPPRYFRAALMLALKQKGVAFVPDSAAAETQLLKSYRLTTAPLTELVEETNQRSQNLHAESLLRHLGKRVHGQGSSEAGLRAEKEFLARLKLDTSAFDLHDGCGLSHDNRVRPQELALLLGRMARRPFGKDYVSTLALPGLDGATGRRLRGFSDEDLIRYKTGSISRVQALCGYIFAIDGDTLATVAMINDFRGAPETAARLLDTLFSHATQWYNKERPAAAIAFKLLNRPDAPTAYLDRLPYFSRALEGTPYFLGPTGEGRFGVVDPHPLIDLSRFDCVTYIESVIALALARKATDVIPAILPIRYRGDTVSFAARNHFFVGDWLANNPQWFRIVRVPGDTVIHKTLFKGKLLSAHGLPKPAVDPAVDIAYLPYDKALQLAGNWNLGNCFLGVAFVTHIEGLDVTHTGFVEVAGGKPPILRHASELKGMVTTQNFKDYLESRRGKCEGVVLFEFLPFSP